MTGRPPLPLGAHGKIVVAEIASDGARVKLFEARCYRRDLDGRTRRVRRTGKSAAAARNALQAALTERRHNAGAALTGASRVREVGAVWLEQRVALVQASDSAPRTFEAYESTWRLHVAPALGELQLREATAARCEAWLVELRKRKGAATCSRARAVLSGVLGLAARMDAIPASPVRDLSPIPGAGARARKPRAMTSDERTAWLAWMDHHVAVEPRRDGTPRGPSARRSVEHTRQTAQSRALGDVTRFMLGTGCRIGETMAVSWDEVDLHVGTVAICWHIVRVKGEGLRRMPGAKSDAGDRVLRLPRWCVEMLLARRVESLAPPVFPDAFGGWRDPNLVSRWFRWSRDEAGFEWVTSHIFRQTVIKVLDEAGLPTREVADQAGHARISQTQGYMTRRIASDRAAEALEDLF